mgnify:FL=1
MSKLEWGWKRQGDFQLPEGPFPTRHGALTDAEFFCDPGEVVRIGPVEYPDLGEALGEIDFTTSLVNWTVRLLNGKAKRTGWHYLGLDLFELHALKDWPEDENPADDLEHALRAWAHKWLKPVDWRLKLDETDLYTIPGADDL